MSKITEELRELATIANILSKGTGSIKVTTSHEPDYSHRDLFKKLAETITDKIDALNAITGPEYLAMLSGADKPEIAAKVKLFFKKGEGQEDLIGKKMFDEMETEKIDPMISKKIEEDQGQLKEQLDSVEKDTIEI